MCFFVGYIFKWMEGGERDMVSQIETKRLVLKNYGEQDLDNLHMLKSEPLVWKYSSNQVTDDIEESKKHLASILEKYDKGMNDFQALYLKSTAEYIGEAGILSFNKKNQRAVIGYNLIPKYWGNGYATEITMGLVKCLFEEEDIERIEALVMEENHASRLVLEKAGFIAEGLLRNFTYIEHKYHNVNYYGMIKSDYKY